MMWLLTVTVCLSAQGAAECRSHVRLFAEREACREAGTLMIAYVKEGDPPGLEFVGAVCAQGLDA